MPGFAARLTRMFRADSRHGFPSDFSPAEIDDIRAVRPYTMTSLERIVAMIRGMQYVIDAKLPGDVVECGVYKGGSVMAAARTLLRAGEAGRTIWLYDTYEGMAEPGELDVSNRNKSARKKWGQTAKWCYAGLEEVRTAVESTGYPPDRLRFVKGKVEDTIPAHAPEQIALLRLDTDWYESTKHELIHLYPRLVRGGVLILDDYGHWQGARQATDEYLAEQGFHLLLSRIDETARMAVKI